MNVSDEKLDVMGLTGRERAILTGHDYSNAKLCRVVVVCHSYWRSERGDVCPHHVPWCHVKRIGFMPAACMVELFQLDR